MKFTHRYLAHIIIEAETPLAIGSGERNVMTDRLVTTDINGFPYIPGTSLTGVLRQSLGELAKNAVNELFGYQNGDLGQGSRLILSSAQMVGKDGKVIDGFGNDLSDEFYKNFQNLPIRQHVKITHQGAAEKHGKFDEQMVYKGTRFCFELELIGDEHDNTIWSRILTEFNNPAFRIGGGTRKGFGEITVIEIKSECIDLTKDLQKYLTKSSDLNGTFWNSIQPIEKMEKYKNADWTTYKLKLTPEDFFLFGSGFSSENGDADMTFVTEKAIIWPEGKPKFSEEKILIPATSVKGALAHRVAFHYNKELKVYSNKLDEPGICTYLIKNGYRIPDDCEEFDSNKLNDKMKMVIDGNPAVRALFGYSANEKDGQIGNAIFSDIFLSSEPKKKLLNHVAIDRFTGGTMDGALFSEEVVGSKESFTLNILVNNKAFETEKCQKAFEAALNDLCNGMLPLGGGTMRGNGCFTGTFTKN